METLDLLKAIRAESGDKGIKGSARTVGKDGNANAHHDWIGRNLGSDGSGQRLIKTLATNSWSSGYGYTKLQFTGACSLIFSPHSAPDIFCFGIVSRPISSTSDGRDNVRIGWSFDGNGNAKLWFNKKEHPDHAKKYAENDIFEVRYDGNYVRWFFNGSYVMRLFRSVIKSLVLELLYIQQVQLLHLHIVLVQLV